MSAAQCAHPISISGRNLITGNSGKAHLPNLEKIFTHGNVVPNLHLTLIDSYILVLTLMDMIPSHNESPMTPTESFASDF